MKQRHQESQTLTRARVDLQSHVTARGIRRRHVMQVAFAGNMQSLPRMHDRALIREPPKRILHSLERERHRQNRLYVRLRQQNRHRIFTSMEWYPTANRLQKVS